MMQTYGTIRNLSHDSVTFECSLTDGTRQWITEKINSNERLRIEISTPRKDRSLNANAYFWKLCDLIAKAVGSDKDTIYLLQLSKYGVFEDIEIITDAKMAILGLFRHVEELYTYQVEKRDMDGNFETVDMICLRCYIGSSQYSSKEMADLINGTVIDAQELGIDTWTRDEIEHAISVWKGR